MYDPSKNLPLLSSLVAKGIVTTAIGAAAAPAAAGAAAAFSVFEIAKVFAPDVTEHMVSVLDYARFKEFLLKTHPGDLNHDLDKLIKGAMIRAVGFIKRLYLDKLKEEHELTLWQRFQRPFAAIDQVLTNMEGDLASELKATTFQKEELERYLMGEHTDCLDRFTNYLFAVSGVDEADDEWQKLRAFFREQLPLLFDLSYKEALKDEANVKAFKAFEIWILEEGLRHQKQLLVGQERILAAITALKADQPPLEHDQVRRQLEADVQRLSALLSREVAGMIAQLSRIEKQVNAVKKDTEVIIKILEEERTQPLNIPHQLTTIPAFGGDFFGRDADVKKLQKALTDSRRVVLMNGTGGVGKTTLAKWFVREHLRQYDHVCWIEMTRQDTVVEGKLVSGSIKETMADHAVLFSNLNLAFNPKEQTIDERFQLITNALRNLPGRNLFVIDNAGADAGEKGVRSLLPQPPNWHVLVTSRQKLTGYELLPLDSLEPEAAKALFRANYTFDCTDEEVTALLEAIGYHTLTTELFAKTLEAHHGMLTVANLLQKVQSKTLNDAALQQTIETEHHPEETEIFLHLMLAFDCADLTPDEKSLLGQLALLPPEPYTVKEQLAPWLGYSDAVKAGPLHQTLGQLVRKGWLTQNEHTYLLHRLLQQVVAYQLSFDWEVTKTLVKSITVLLKTVDNPNALAVYPLRKYGEFLLAGIPDAHTGTPETARLNNNLALIYKDLGRYEEAASLLEGALKSDQTNFGPDHPAVAVSQSNLALVVLELNQVDLAYRLLQEAERVFVLRLGEHHPYTVSIRSWLTHVESKR